MDMSLQFLVEEALAGDHDMDDAWRQLDRALEATPGDVQARRLRIRLADAAGRRTDQLRDLEALCAVYPADRDLALEHALALHRWGFLLVDDDKASDADDVEGAVDALRASAVTRLIALAEAHAVDADFMHAFFDSWDDYSVWQPWQRLRLTMLTAAARPDDSRMRRQLAKSWLALVGHAPSVDIPEGGVPVGFTADVFGNLQDALIAERALASLSDCFAFGEDLAALTEQRAGLHLALSRFAEAGADYRAAAAHYADEALAASEDMVMRDALLARAKEAGEMACQCVGGRQALTDHHLRQMNQALSGLDQSWADSADSPPEVAQLVAEMRADGKRTRDHLLQELLDISSAMRQAAQEPDEVSRAQMRSLAETLAGQMLGAVSFTPAEWRARDWARVATELDPRLRLVDAQFRATGLDFIGIVEHMDYGRQFGQPVLFGLWSHPSGDSLVTYVAVGALEVTDVETEFVDGRQMVTTTGRARNYMQGGPRVDTLHVDGDVPLEELINIHRARVALALAFEPGLAAQPVSSAAEFIAMQERQRKAKTAFRLTEGLSDFEALGLPGGPPEYFGPLVRAAVRRRLTEAYNTFMAAGGR